MIHKKIMSFLDEMKNQYGYQAAVSILKSKIEEAFKEGRTWCTFYDSPSIIERLMADPEFEGFTFKEAKNPASKPGNIGKLICWQ